MPLELYCRLCTREHVDLCTHGVIWSYRYCSGFWFLELLCTIFPIVSFLSITGIFVSFLKKKNQRVGVYLTCIYHSAIVPPLVSWSPSHSFFVPVSFSHIFSIVFVLSSTSTISLLFVFFMFFLFGCNSKYRLVYPYFQPFLRQSKHCQDRKQKTKYVVRCR